jgi:hypothetical protein
MPQNTQQAADSRVPASQTTINQASTAIVQRINEINTRVRLCEEKE